MLNHPVLAESLRRAETPRDRRDALRAAALSLEGVKSLLQDARDARLRDPVQASRLCRAALTAARAGKHADLAMDAERLLGQVLLLLGRPRHAVSRFRSVWRRGDADLHGRLAPEIANALTLLGKGDEALGLIADARRGLTGSDRGARRAFLDVAEGNLLRRFDRGEEALRCLNRARRVLSRTGSPALIAAVDASRGNILGTLQKYEAADRVYRRSAAYYRDAGQESMALRVEYNHAYLLFLRGRFQQALMRFHELRARFAAAGDEYHVALCDLDEAELDLRLNLYAVAAVHAERAASTLDRLGIPQDAARARFFAAIATRRESRSQRAVEALLAAREAFRAQGCEAWEAICLHRLAECDRDAGDRASARARATEAAERLKALGFRERAGRAEVLLARLDGDAGATELCIERLERLARELRDLHAPWLACEVHHQLGRAHAVLGRARPAVRHALRAVRILERHRVTIPPDEYMASFLRDKHQIYEDAVFFLLWLGGRRARERAFEIAEQAKGRALLDLLKGRAPAPAKSASKALCNAADELGREIDGLLGRMPSAEPGMRGAASTATREAARVKELRLEATLERLRERDPRAAALRRGASATWEEVAAALPDDTTLVEFFVGREETLWFVVTRHGVRVERRRLDAAAFETAVKGLDARIAARDRSGDPAAAVAALDELGELALGPVRGLLGTKRLVFVPHGPLHGVPFHALSLGGRALVDDHEVTVAPSTTVWIHCRRAKRCRKGPALILGVPDGSAPRIAEEVRVLLAKTGDAQAYVGPSATREVLRREGRRARVIHLATHARHDEHDPMLSGLQLGDGWLTVQDAYSLSLSPEVLVLSGCATGRSAVTEGDDLFGLVRGFLHAGAPTIVSSLWPVEDEVALRFTTAFHEALDRSESPAGALRAAALSVRLTHPHPRHWAAFVLIGSGEPFSR